MGENGGNKRGADFAITGNELEFKYNIDEGVVTGSGKYEIHKLSQFEGDPESMDTYFYEFEGKVDPGTKEVTGIVKVSNINECKAYCEGTTAYYTGEYTANWNGKFNKDDSVLNGKVEYFSAFIANEGPAKP